MKPRATLDEEALGLLVERFYAQVRCDDLIGALFNEAVHDWPAHTSRLTAFWSSVMLSSGNYKGQPVAAHLRHRGEITPPMFDRWLSIWRKVTSELFAAEIAGALQAKADRIAESLRLALFFRLDQHAPDPALQKEFRHADYT